MTQSCLALEMVRIKFWRMCWPRGEWVTSGWNWRPHIWVVRFSMATKSELDVPAVGDDDDFKTRNIILGMRFSFQVLHGEEIMLVT